MRSVRDVGAWTLLWVVLSILTLATAVGPQSIALVSLTGGVLAGACIVTPRVRWWPLITTAVVVSVVAYSLLGRPLWLAAIRGLSDTGAAVAYALIILRFRRTSAALGAQIRWVLVALAVAVAVRGIGIAVRVAYDASATEQAQHLGWMEYVLGTLTGYVAGTAMVLAVTQWRPAFRSFGRAREFVGATAAAIAFIALVMFTPIGSNVPGAVFLVVPVLLFAAIRAPVAVTAMLTGCTVLCIGIAAAHSLGPFDQLNDDDATQLLTVQVATFVLATSIFLLTATVGERRHAQREADRAAVGMRTVFAESPVASAWVSLDGDRPMGIREANPAFLALLGLDKAEAEGTELRAVLVDPRTSEPVDVVTGRDVCVRSASGARWLRPTLSEPAQLDPMAEAADTRPSAVLTLEDVTTARASEDLLRQQMRRDNLTGLPNRGVLLERLDSALQGRASGDCLGLLLADIDGLKSLNCSRGYTVGDEIIIQTGQRLADALDPGDQLLRVAGDEFVVIAVRSSGEALSDLADRLVAAIREPLVADDEQIAMTLSVGVVIADDAHRHPAAELLRRADIALSRAEDDGKDRSALFTRRDDMPTIDRLGIADRLRHALTHDELVLLYQPIVLIATGVVTSAEALVRLREPDGGYTPPSRFLPFAAEVGLMGTITEQVLEKACSAAQHWQRGGVPVRVAFNAPPRWLSAEAVNHVADCIDRHGLPWETMTLEVTEEETLDLSSDILDALKSLRERGMHIAIDDFGTGFAGLDSFRSIPADIVKIDRSFVIDMLRSPQDSDFVRSMIDLIHRFGKLALAEGVETEEQLEALRMMGGDYGQGYLFGRPVELSDFPAGRTLGPATTVVA